LSWKNAVYALLIGLQPAHAAELKDRGEWLYRVAGCVGCHSPPESDRPHLSGGRDNPTPFGVFYAPNISPHPTDGIGDWSREDFDRAIRRGRSPDGRAYWPTFPYMAYTAMTDEDVDALWAYLRAQPSVEGTVPDHAPEPRYRNLLFLWRMFAFRSRRFTPDQDRSDTWNRGAYLVRAVSYCGECHTPRTGTGLLVKRRYMAGGANPGKDELHPNLTPHPTAGLGKWTEQDIADYLRTGIDPEGRATRTDWVMHEKVRDSFSYYSEADRLAIAAYLRSLPPIDFDPAAQGWIPDEALTP
jgi:mono/diheme cytochrome c family protein